MTSISHAPPKTVLVVKLGVSEDYDPTFYGYYPSGTCFQFQLQEVFSTSIARSVLFSNSASAQWLSPMHFYYRCGSSCYLFL